MSRMDATRVADRASFVAPRVQVAWRASNHHVFCLTALLFLSPNALFALSALRPAPAIAVLAGCASVSWFVWRARASGRLLSTSVDPGKLGSCVAIALTLCVLGGQGHLVYAYPDWLTRDAVLADLMRDGLTGIYHYRGQDYYLRAPVGMYMLPAAVGHVFGLHAAHLALLVANGVIFGLLLYIACILAGPSVAAFLAILIAFSGVDLLGALAVQISAPGGIGWTVLEWWSLDFDPSIPLQYSSMVTQLFWAPNHAAPGWFIAILVLLRCRDEIRLSTFVACCASLILWSPLAVVGALPFGALFAMRRPLRETLTVENLLAGAAGLGFLPIALYLVTTADTLSSGAQSLSPGLGRVLVLFLLVEIPQAMILFDARRRVDPADRGALVVAVLTLCLLPFFIFGPSNDLVLRASIPSLFLIAFSFARIAATTPRENSAFRAIWLIVILSAATPASQIVRPLMLARFAVSDCNMLTMWQSIDPIGFPGNYLAPAASAPKWLRARDSTTPRLLEYRDCWPDHPLRDIMRGDRG